MRVVLLGASGMLGQALTAEGCERGHTMITTRVDITDSVSLIMHLQGHQPDVIINAAALTDLNACQSNPTLAEDINAWPLTWIADWVFSRVNGLPKLVQISSDQCGKSTNQYALSKQKGEVLALDAPYSLVVRTNIVGPRNMAWAFEAIENDTPMTLFSDYITSSIDIWAFSKILFDLLETRRDVCGILNIASRTASSKQEFIEALAKKMGKPLTRATVGSVQEIADGIQRSSDCALDVSIIENLLHRPMPELCDVINALVERRIQPCINPSLLMAG